MIPNIGESQPDRQAMDDRVRATIPESVFGKLKAEMRVSENSRPDSWSIPMDSTGLYFLIDHLKAEVCKLTRGFDPRGSFGIMVDNEIDKRLFNDISDATTTTFTFTGIEAEE